MAVPSRSSTLLTPVSTTATITPSPRDVAPHASGAPIARRCQLLGVHRIVGEVRRQGEGLEHDLGLRHLDQGMARQGRQSTADIAHPALGQGLVDGEGMDPLEVGAEDALDLLQVRLRSAVHQVDHHRARPGPGGHRRHFGDLTLSLPGPQGEHEPPEGHESCQSAESSAHAASLPRGALDIRINSVTACTISVGPGTFLDGGAPTRCAGPRASTRPRPLRPGSDRGSSTAAPRHRRPRGARRGPPRRCPPRDPPAAAPGNPCAWATG